MNGLNAEYWQQRHEDLESIKRVAAKVEAILAATAIAQVVRGPQLMTQHFPEGGGGE